MKNTGLFTPIQGAMSLNPGRARQFGNRSWPIYHKETWSFKLSKIIETIINDWFWFERLKIKQNHAHSNNGWNWALTTRTNWPHPFFPGFNCLALWSIRNRPGMHAYNNGESQNDNVESKSQVTFKRNPKSSQTPLGFLISTVLLLK